jgi:hypothetical protein
VAVGAAAGTAGLVAGGASGGATVWTAAALGACGCALLGIALALRAPVLVAPAAGLVGSAYAVALALDAGTADLRAPVVGAGLLLTCELAYWSHEVRTTSPDEPGALAHRSAWLALLTLLALLAGAALLAVSDLLPVEGITIDAVGAVAAGALIATFAVAVHLRRSVA